jgi:tetratricopeptide (TPR) repeat protein
MNYRCLLVAAVIAAVIGGLQVGPERPHAAWGRADQADGGTATPAGDQGAPGAAQPDADKPDSGKPDEPPPKKDQDDIRNAIGDLSLVRGLNKLEKPQPKSLAATLSNQPYFTPAVRARKLLFFGLYDQAELRYGELLRAQPDNQEYIEGYLESILRQGKQADLQRFDAKMQPLTDQQRGTARMTRLRAEALVDQGKRAAARSLRKAFVDAHPKLEKNNLDPQLVAVYTAYAQALEDAAEYPAAAAIYEKVTPLAEGDLPDDPFAATQIALAVERDALLTATARDKHRSVLYILHQVEEQDATYWPAKLLEADILMAGHNEKDAGAALAEALDLNPNELHARFLAVDHAIANYDFDAANAALKDLSDRSDSPDVEAYQGRLLLQERLPERAIAPLADAVARDPENARARGWLAGAYYLMNDKDNMDRQLHALTLGGGGGPHPVVLFEAAEILRDARQYPLAEQLYMQADHAAPWWAEPTSALAQLYLETGEEAKAKAAYDKSFAIDPFNLRAYNQMTLLDSLSRFATKESTMRLNPTGPGSDQPAFIIRYDKKDEVLAELAMQWLEKVRPQLWSYFQIHSLPAPTQIELFPSHEEFGVRTTGLPWIGTVGACTGNVIAMDVPRSGADYLVGTFDWARTLRHEYTHTITLAMTLNRIPHWLTEAAACEQEQAPRDWENCQLLASNFRAGTLFKIADLNWGFIKPKRSIDRQLAYMQSQWLYEYLVAQYGLPKMLDFLKAFHDGDTEAVAWQVTYGKTMEQMDAQFHDWAGTQIQSWGLPSDPLPKRADLDATLKKNPDDVPSLVNLGWLLASANDLAGAQKQLEKAIALDAGNIRARELLGTVLSKKDKAKARTLLEGVVADDPHRPVAVRTLGLMAMDRKDYDDAEKWFKQLQQLRPMDDASYTNLAGIYLLRKDSRAAIAELQELCNHEQKDDRIPRRLSELYAQSNDLPDAESAAFRAVRINPYSAIDHMELGRILIAEKNPRTAVEYFQHAVQLQPQQVACWEGLADAKGLSGDAPGAAEAAKKAEALNPDTQAKKWAK